MSVEKERLVRTIREQEQQLEKVRREKQKPSAKKTTDSKTIPLASNT